MMHLSPDRKLPHLPDGQEIDPRHHFTERSWDKQLGLTGTQRVFPHPDCGPDWDRDSESEWEFELERELDRELELE